MAHLERDVAAFVDGQLSPESTAAARLHLQECDRCRDAVSQQRLLKTRMQTGSVPAPPLALLASLSSVPTVASVPESRRERLRRSPLLGVGAALVGACVAVAGLGFLAGAHEDRDADPVRPPFAEYALEFDTGHNVAADTMTVADLDELDANGWPCHQTLAGDLERVDGRWHGEDASTVSLTYTDGRHRLRLYERTGSLDERALQGFGLRTIGERQLWVDEGEPTVLAWDADGMVFIAVTDLGEERLAEVLAELPEPRQPRDAAARVGEGLDRMASWVSP
ncbi:anti-sigma factor family protein [Aeromicrobium sp. CF4.19]|uniref:anti-sigma factor family protein n=1 Tax=Aeromicrobium sp. CF4.19 TaxID=3373082 RepID=UPI003EE4CEB4